MTNLTLTINLDSLTATQLAALQVAALIGMPLGWATAIKAISAAGWANCGDEYPPEFKRVSDFLMNLDKEEA